MVGANKILTVSYGTFSCTLEGFDEPFSTMKAIAEYFRDLAADDRYFGAEPPTPDAEMLHRIAEREIQRRVEAKIGANSVVLRPDATPLVAEAAAPVADPVAAPEPVAAAPIAEPRTVEATPPVEAPVAATPVETVAQKLARLRAQAAALEAEAEAELAAEPAPPEADFGYEIDLGDLDALAAEELTEEGPAPLVLADPVAADIAEEPAAPAEEPEVAATTEAVAEMVNAPETAVAEVVDDEDDILAVLETSPEPAPLPEAVDEPAPEVAEIGEALAPEAETEVAPETAPRRPRLVKLRRLVAPAPQRAAVEVAAQIEDAEIVAPEQVTPEPVADTAPAGVDASLLDGADLSAEEEADLLAELNAALEEAPAAEPAPVAAELTAPEEPAAALDGDLSRLMQEANTKLEGPESRRRLSAIAHLKAAVAATFAERRLREERGITESPETAADAEPYRDDLTHAVRPRRPEAGSATGTQRPQLPGAGRAAPLVLVSEQRIDRPGEALPGSLPVVRPRRITAEMLAQRAAELPRPAEAPAPARPSAVAANFAEFAERLGAGTLEEMLEAAAAYTATIEGQTVFSRPHLMSKVAHAAEDGGFTREDGLRSFGTLLRQGRILRTEDGQFALAADSHFLTEARRLAG